MRRRLRDGFVVALLRSPLHRMLGGSLLSIRVTGRRTGHEHWLPVMYAADELGLVIFVGRPEGKAWWRNLQEAAPVRVRLRGAEFDGRGEVARGAPVADRYLKRFPRASAAVTATTDPTFVVVGGLRPRS
jgi:hypothetical protein